MVKRSPQTFAFGVAASSGMASLVHLDNLECASGAGSTNEQITKLFPKCRPRDINLNPVVTHHPHHTQSSAFDDLSNDNTGVQDADTDRCILKQLKENRELAQPETTSSASAPPADGAETLTFRQVNHHLLHHLTASTATSSSTTTSGDDERDGSEDDEDELLDDLDPLAGARIETTHVTTTNLMDDPLILESLSAEACQDMSALAAGYKLRDSRIIEIAGGRELYSASRSKASRGGGGSSAGGSGKPKPGVWELRARCSSGGDGGDSDGSIGGTGSEVTETVFASEVLSLRHGSGTAGSLNVATIAGREVVVFDDIGEDWRGGVRLDLNKVRLPVLDDEPLEASPPSPACRRGAIDFFQAVASGSELDGGVGAGGRVGSSLAQHPTSGSNSNTNKGPRLIGGVPIAEYEGSPRRYGRSGNVTSTNGNDSAPVLPTAQSLLASPSVYPPRPGFPQRVLPADADDEDSCPSPTPGVVTETNTTSAFDYLYEFSETRKVLEEFFKNPAPSETSTKEFEELDYELRRQSGPSTNINNTSNGNAYVGLRLSKVASNNSALNGGGVSEDDDEESKCPRIGLGSEMIESVERHFLDLSADTGSTDDLGENEVGQSRNFTLSPETTDCDSNCGDLDSEASLMLLDSSDGVGVVGDGSGVLAGLGSASLGGGGGSTGSGIPDTLRLYSSMPVLEDGLSSGHASDTENVSNPATVAMLMKRQITEIEKELGNGGPRSLRVSGPSSGLLRNSSSPENITLRVPTHPLEGSPNSQDNGLLNVNSRSRHDSYDTADPELEALDPLGAPQATPPPPAPAPHRSSLELANNSVAVPTTNSTPASASSTQQTTNSNGANSTSVEAAIKDIRLALQRAKTLPLKSPSSALHDQEMADSPIWIPRRRGGGTSSSEDPDHRKSHDEPGEEEEADTDLETDRLLGQQRTDDHGFFDDKTDKENNKRKGRNKEVLIEGVLFRARYLGSTQLVCEGQPTKTTRMLQAEEAVSRIKALAPEGETQPSTEVDLFISTEKIMVLNTDLKEIMMDHALRTISYIADIGDLVVLMARRRFVPHDVDEPAKLSRAPKMICHVFESEEAQFIAQSIGQAFQVAYMEFLKANGIEDHSFVKEMDYQEVLNSQEIFGDELQMFAKKEMQKEVVVPKAKGEILGVVIVESGWGSMLPTVVIANLAPAGAAARCGQLNIGDQIIAINGVSLVGLPLSTCQNYIKNTKNQTVVKLTVVPCAPVVEVKIKRPDTKYQLGFSVQNGVICSLLRGGIAERGGVRVGHRIIEINNQSVVAVPHEKIVNLLATSVGEILMKTMPTSMFRLLTGQETPVFI